MIAVDRQTRAKGSMARMCAMLPFVHCAGSAYVLRTKNYPPRKQMFSEYGVLEYVPLRSSLAISNLVLRPKKLEANAPEYKRAPHCFVIARSRLKVRNYTFFSTARRK